MPHQAHMWATVSHAPWWAGTEGQFCWEHQTIWRNQMEVRSSFMTPKGLHVFRRRDLGIGEGSVLSRSQGRLGYQ